MEFTLVWFLIPYLALILLVLIITGVNVYHIVRFGRFDLQNRIMVTVFTILTVTVLVVAAGYLFGVDWGQTIGAELPEFRAPEFQRP